MQQKQLDRQQWSAQGGRKNSYAGTLSQTVEKRPITANRMEYRRSHSQTRGGPTRNYTSYGSRSKLGYEQQMGADNMSNYTYNQLNDSQNWEDCEIC